LKDVRDGGGWDSQPIPPAALEDGFGSINAEVVERFGGGLERSDFGGGQLVSGGFVPVRAFLVGVVGKPEVFGLLAPVGAGLERVPLHQELM
jgi:hypothetical protein